VGIVARASDNDAAIAVADEHGGPVLSIQHAVGRGDVIVQRCLRRLGDGDVVAVLGENVVDDENSARRRLRKHRISARGL
jgi:hypothetical protein